MKTDGDLNGATFGIGHCEKNTADLQLMLNNGVSGTLSLSFSKRADSKVTMDVTFTFMPNAVFNNKVTGKNNIL